jgi:hypothetical protein
LRSPDVSRTLPFDILINTDPAKAVALLSIEPDKPGGTGASDMVLTSCVDQGPLFERTERRLHSRETPLRFLEIFTSDHHAGVSLDQWLALTPRQLVEAHLNLSDDVLSRLPTNEQTIVSKCALASKVALRNERCSRKLRDLGRLRTRSDVPPWQVALRRCRSQSLRETESSIEGGALR